MWSMWLTVAVVALSLASAKQKCDWNDDCPAPRDHSSFASVSAEKPHFRESSPSSLAPSLDNGEAEETVESHIFPGMMVPPEVEDALGTLLSKETVQWIDQQEAEGKDVVNLHGQIIPDDMKEVIRNFVQRNDPEYKKNKRTPTMEAVQVRDRGTKPASPYVDKRRPMELDRPPKRSTMQLWEKWTKPVVTMIAKREVLMGLMLTVLSISIVAAMLFVYGVSEIWTAVTQSASVLGHRCKNTSVSEEHRVEDKPTIKPITKSNNRSKSSSKKRSKSTTTRSRNEPTEIKREIVEGKPTKKIVGEPSEEDENNDWQEVMHNKAKCRGRSKQLQEEDSYPIASKGVSQPATPKTPPQSTPKSEETVTSPVKPIKTGPPSIKRESWTPHDEANVGLQLTMTSSGAFSDEKTPSSGFDLSTLANETYILQSPVQQSPFAASTDLPFFTGSPIRGGYPPVHTPTEQQFQSKVDCLLRNLRNKPFSMHPVSSHQHLRRTATDLEERMFGHRMGLSVPSSFNGSLDPTLSSSGMLNNRLIYSEDGYMTRQFSGGLPPVRSGRMRQRAGSLPLTQSQSPTFYSPGQGGMSAVPGQGLSNNCSLFSSNPSIWSVDLAVDRDLVKSSMTNSSSLRQAPSGESLDFKRCLPDQLLSEMGSPDPYP